MLYNSVNFVFVNGKIVWYLVIRWLLFIKMWFLLMKEVIVFIIFKSKYEWWMLLKLIIFKILKELLFWLRIRFDWVMLLWSILWWRSESLGIMCVLNLFSILWMRRLFFLFLIKVRYFLRDRKFFIFYLFSLLCSSGYWSF